MFVGRRLIEVATARFDPVKAEEDRLKAADGRRFDLDLANVGIDGIVHLDAALDLADALDLEAAIACIAHQLLELGCDKPLDVRRSIAAGELARAQGGLDLGDRRWVVGPGVSRLLAQRLRAPQPPAALLIELVEITPPPPPALLIELVEITPPPPPALLIELVEITPPPPPGPKVSPGVATPGPRSPWVRFVTGAATPQRT